MGLLYRAFVEKFNKEQEERQDGNPYQWKSLPNLTELGKWTTPERINPELYKEISRHKIDTTKAISKIYEISETTRLQAKTITETYEELQYVLQHTTNWEEVRAIIQKTAEQSKRLAISKFIQKKTKNELQETTPLMPSTFHQAFDTMLQRKKTTKQPMLSATSLSTTFIRPVRNENLLPKNPIITSNTQTEGEEMDTTEEIEEIREDPATIFSTLLSLR
ncbi:unnamed protein product [Rhizopus stolonifer]